MSANQIHSPLLADVVGVLDRTIALYDGRSSVEHLRQVRSRIDEPLRVAIAGKVKAGKSTLLNALVGEELAPTDEGECTRIVTWYRNGITYRVTLVPWSGAPQQVPFTRDQGAIEVQLGNFRPDDVANLTVDWPTASLARITLVDTPGIASLSTDVSARTHAFLTPDNDEPAPADAVLYLMRHLHSTDINFLEAFHEEEFAQPSPVNAIAVLSRADEIGVGRIDSMTSADRIARRYRDDPKVRRLVQTVTPVAGLLAQSGSTLRESDFRALAVLAEADRNDVDLLFLSADRFGHGSTAVPLDTEVRQELLSRLGLFGVRLSTAFIRAGRATNATQLARLLVERSGLNELRKVLLSQFAARADVLKARSALLALDRVLQTDPVPEAKALAAEVERVHAGAHDFAELRLLNALRIGHINMREEETRQMERLLGAEGTTPTERLGLDENASEAEIREALAQMIGRWQRRAENPISTRPVAEASRVLVRTCEGLYATLAARAG
ncbi:MAG: dynamin family protein [Actinomycetota bacterium]|nr:dynamin family protein [Actinomycetota bacterium]